jgi:hypothetical protein
MSDEILQQSYQSILTPLSRACALQKDCRKRSLIALLALSVLLSGICPPPGFAQTGQALLDRFRVKPMPNTCTVDLSTWPDVAKLLADADALLAKDAGVEAVERYKDCLCLAELQAFPNEKLRALSLLIAQRLQGKQSGNSSSYFFDKALGWMNLNSASSLVEIESILQRPSDGAQLDSALANRMFEQLCNVQTKSREEKIKQINCLIAFARRLQGDVALRGTRIAAMQKYLQLLNELEPPDLPLQFSALSAIPLDFTAYSASKLNPHEIVFLHDTMANLLKFVQTHNEYHFDASGALEILIKHEPIESVIPLLESQLEFLRADMVEKKSMYAFRLNQLGWAYLADNRNIDAERRFKEAFTSTQDNIFHQSDFEESQLGLAKSYYAQLEYKKCQKVLTSLLAFLAKPNIADHRGGEASANALLGRCYLQLKNQGRAARCFEKAHELFTNSVIDFGRNSFQSSSINQLDSHKDVLTALAEMYSSRGASAKEQRVRKALAELEAKEAAAKWANQNQEVRDQAQRMGYYSVQDAVFRCSQYLLFLRSSESLSKAHQSTVLDELILLAHASMNRGLSGAAQAALIQAKPLATTETQARQIRRAEAVAVLLQREYDACRDLLKTNLKEEPPSSGQALVDQSLMARAFLWQGELDKASAMFEQILPSWDKSKRDAISAYLMCRYDRASMLVQQGHFEKAESELKEVLKDNDLRSTQQGPMPIGTSKSLVLSLLAVSEAKRGTGGIAEGALNLRQGQVELQSFEHGLENVEFLINSATFYESSGDADRARRLYLNALREVEAMSLYTGRRLDLLCRDRIIAITPNCVLH